MNILIVDDIAQNRKLLRTLLEAENLTVFDAADGVEALAVLDREQIDAIISDILMPRMDGYRFCYEVRRSERFYQIPFIFYTSTYTSPSDEKAAVDLGADKFLKKPAPSEVILAAVREATDPKSRRPAKRIQPLEEKVMMREYSDRLVAKLEQKNIEATAAEAKFRALVEQSLVGIYVIQDEKFVYVNPKMSEIFGFSAEALCAPPAYDFVLPEDRELVRTNLRKRVEGTVQSIYYGLRIKRATGDLRYVEAHGSRIEYEGRVAVLGTMLDITERKHSEDALRESERRFSEMMQRVELISLMLDREARITYCNDYLLRITGWRREEVFGRDWFELFIPPENVELKDVFASLLADRPQAWHHENEILTRSGERRLIRWNNSVLRSISGEIIGAASIGEDVTERQQALAALSERAQLSALGAEVGAALAEGHALRASLQSCTAAMVKHLDAAFARIWTLNEAGDTLELQASAGLYTHIDGGHARVPLGKFKIGLIAQERKPHLTNSVIGDPRVPEQEWAKREGLVSFAGYPMLVDGQLIGVMALFARKPIDDFALEALRSIAELIGLGIQRKQGEEALRESEAKFRQLAENINEVFWITTADWNKVLYVSPVYEKIWGRTCDSVYADAKSWMEAVIPSDRPAVYTATLKAGRGEAYAVEYRIRRPDREIRWIEDRGFPIRDESGRVMRVVGVAEDITDRKSAEQRLATHHDATRILAESPTLAEAALKILQTICQNLQWDVGELWTVDHPANVLRCVEIWHPQSTEFEEFVKASRKSTFPPDKGLPGRVWKSAQPLWIADLNREPGFTRRVVAGESGLHSAIFFPIKLRDEVVGVIDLFSAKARESDADLQVMFATIGSQIGQFIERKIVEDKFRQSQKMEAIGQLAGGVAHDFNNILTIVQGYTQMLLEDEDIVGETKEQLQEVLSAAQRAAGLTRQLLMFSRKQVMQSQTLDLNEVIENLGKMLRRIIGEDVKFQTELAPELPSIQADAGMMEQVLMNLSVNARDAMRKGGQLTFGTELVRADSAYVRQRPEAREGDFVCLTVRDTGCGMTPEVIGHIFEPFFTTKAVGEGTGLGLSTVYGIVQQHQGWIEVNSQVGRGTTFKVLLPVAKMEIALEAEVVSPKELDGTETILLVEDEIALRGLAKKVLERRGYKVLEASSGIDALAVWDQHRAQIDLVLTDMVMPGGLTGRELAEKLKAQKPALRVLYSSGYSEKEGDTAFLLKEGRNFLHKPYHPQKLLQAVRNCLDEKEA